MKFLALSLLTLAPLAFAQTMPTGWVNIVSENSGKCLDIIGGTGAVGAGIHVDQFTCATPAATNQSFRFVPESTGGYQIQVNNSGLALQPLNGSTASETAIVQQPYTGANYQVWLAAALGNGYYSLSPLSSTSSCMDVYGASLLNQTNVQEFACHTGPNQAWQFVPVVLPGSSSAAVKLTWTPSTTTNVTYSVYRATACGPYAKIASGLTSTAYTDSSVSNSSIYQYVATAVDGGNNESAYSNVFSIAVPTT